MTSTTRYSTEKALASRNLWNRRRWLAASRLSDGISGIGWCIGIALAGGERRVCSCWAHLTYVPNVVRVINRPMPSSCRRPVHEDNEKTLAAPKTRIAKTIRRRRRERVYQRRNGNRVPMKFRLGGD